MVVYYFSMALSAEKCKLYYAGKINSVVVTADNGETIQLPLLRFRPFMTTIGLRGRFRLRLGDNNKFLDLQQIA